jgi:serine/threonine-protein kinase HipA
MEEINKLLVFLLFNEQEIKVGELISEGKKIYFKYDSEFIKRKLEISPIKLKVNELINCADYLPFNGLYGIFADSLPDGWGALLLDRALAEKGISIEEITPLLRLAIVGSSGMGALIYKPEQAILSNFVFDINLNQIEQASSKIITGKESNIVDELYLLGGSSGGARPKIFVGYHPKKQTLIPYQNNLPPGFEHWIIKFSSSYDRPDIANIEMAYYKMALDAGIAMSRCKLFTSVSGKVYFGTKRFDREGNNRLLMHSASGMMHDNFRTSNMDYGNLMDCAFKIEKDKRVYEKILRLASFNVFAHNRDDHSKNFSFLMNEKGEWKFAPAYDLTFSTSGHGMHSTMIAGQSANPTKKDLLELANYFSVQNADAIIDEVKGVINNWKKYADKYGVSTISKNKIQKVIGVK